MKKKILITGGAGGIGSTLGRLLVSFGASVVSLDNLHNGYLENLDPSIQNIKESVYSTFLPRIVKEVSPDYIVHMAGVSSLPDCEKDPMECYMTNTVGTLNVLDSARINGIKDIIFTSTSAVYENNDEFPFTEDMEVKPTLNYSLSKKLAEEICHSYIENHGMNVTILRLFNVFGPRQDIYRKSPPLINYIVKEIMNGRAPVLHSNGEQRRDYISVDKVCEVIVRLLERGLKVGTYNVCSGETFSVNDIYEEICLRFHFTKASTYNAASELWKDYGLTLDKSIVAKETNKYSRGCPEKATRELGVSFKEDTLRLIADTAVEISKLYSQKL